MAGCSSSRGPPAAYSDLTVAELLDEYLPVAGWDVSTEEANLGYIRRAIKPALGSKEARKVQGPLPGQDLLHPPVAMTRRGWRSPDPRAAPPRRRARRRRHVGRRRHGHRLVLDVPAPA